MLHINAEDSNLVVTLIIECPIPDNPAARITAGVFLKNSGNAGIINSTIASAFENCTGFYSFDCFKVLKSMDFIQQKPKKKEYSYGKA